MFNLRLLTEQEVRNGLLHLLTYKPFTQTTDFVNSLGGASTWTTDTVTVKIGSYPRNEGAYEAAVVTRDGSIVKRNLGFLEGIRPAVKFSEIEKICKNLRFDELGIGYAEYGEYPQSKVKENKKLDEKLEKGSLQETKRTYTIVDRKYRNTFNEPFCPWLGRFEVNHKNPFIKLKEYRDETGNKYVKNGNDWYKVEPLVWRIDTKKDIAITEKIINNGTHIGGDYSIKNYLKNYLAKDITRTRKSKVRVTRINLENVDKDTVINKNVTELGICQKQKVKSK